MWERSKKRINFKMNQALKYLLCLSKYFFVVVFDDESIVSEIHLGTKSLLVSVLITQYKLSPITSKI